MGIFLKLEPAYQYSRPVPDYLPSPLDWEIAGITLLRNE